MKTRNLSALVLLICSVVCNVFAQTPQKAGPTDYLAPPDFPVGTFFSVYSDHPAHGTARGAWSANPPLTASTSVYTITSGNECRLITLKPNTAGNDPTAVFQLSGADYKKDVSVHNRIRFDIWLQEEIPDNTIYFGLCSPGGGDYRLLRRPVQAIGGSDVQKWVTVDFAVDELTCYWENFDKDLILKGLEEVRFMAESWNNFSKTFYVDNIYFYTQEADLSTPDAPSFLPPVISNANDVVSVFSDSYTNSGNVPTLSPAAETVPVKENDTWKFENTGSIIASFGSSGLNIPGMTHVHLDVWTETASDIGIKLNNSTQQYNVRTADREWLRLNIPLSHFQSGLTNVSSLLITGENKTYFVDNIYFYKAQTPFTVDITAFNAALYRGINFGDIFEFENESRWRPEYMEMVADKGFSHVRLPVRWDDFGRSMDSAPYNIEPEFLNTIKEVVDLAVQNNLKIIVNMHHHTKLSANPLGQKDRFVAQWTQIAEYFRNYPENLAFEIFNEPYADDSGNSYITPEIWNDLLEAALDAIRETNPTRPVLVGPARGGGIDGLSELELPADDSNLIVTVHYYNPSSFTHQGAEWSNPIPPVGTEWLDTENDRINVENDFRLITNFTATENRPIHIGEFGAYEKADMDSRVRWTTYLARYAEQQGYSWAYWDFEAKFGIYDPVNMQFRQPLVDALLSNPIPEEPASNGLTVSEVSYDSNRDGTNGFNGYGYSSVSHNAGEMTIRITNGGTNLWDVQSSMPFGLQKGATYRVSFTVSTDVANSATYQNYFQNPATYAKYSPMQLFTPTTTPTAYSYIFTMNEEDNPNAAVYFDLGGGGESPQTITFRDIKIEKGENRFVAAPVPVLGNNEVNNIYSSVYPGNKPVSYSNPGKMTTIGDNNNGEVILFSDFDEQTITLQQNLSPGEKNVLHLEAYAGSPLKLQISLGGNINKTVNYDLPSHEWTSLDIDLSAILTSGKYINSIKLSGGSGSGRKLFLDHLYFYKNTLRVPVKSNAISSEDVEAGQAKVYTIPGNVVIERYAVSGTQNAESKTQNGIRIYNINGQLIINEPYHVQRTTYRYKVPAGTYLVAVGDKVVKVIVKD